MQTYTDEELVNLYINTNKSSYFSLLYERYSDKVRQRCFSFTRDEIQAEDLAQDIFLRLIHRLTTYKQEAKFSTWLFTVTRNYCTDYIRLPRIKQEASIHEDSTCFNGLASDPNQLTDHEAAELAERQLKLALTLLEPEEQWLLQMKYMDEVSIKEISDKYSITQSAVKMRLKRSRDRLKQCYMKLLDDPLGFELIYN